MSLASIGGQSGTFAEEGVKYPRDLEPSEYDGLPAGWKAIEYAFKSGTSAGKTYVRFKSSFAPSVCTVKQSIQKQAEHDGLPAEEVTKMVKAFEEDQKIKKERKMQEQLDSGQSKITGKKREQAVDAFRKKHGSHDGATASMLPGWKAVSIWREACQQLAVIYHNEGNHPFSTVMDIEAFYGLKILKGEVLDCIDIARSRVVRDENGKVINTARQEVSVTRTAEESGQTRGKRRRIGTVSLESYQDYSSLALVPVLVGGTASSDDSIPQVDSELKATATDIHNLLTKRGLKESQLLAVQGCETGHKYAEVLQGIFYSMSDKFDGQLCFQRISKSSAGALVCNKTYIFWSSGQQQWRIGVLDDRRAPFAYATADQESHPWHKLQWRLLPQV